jgi:hypothetical protein
VSGRERPRLRARQREIAASLADRSARAATEVHHLAELADRWRVPVDPRVPIAVKALLSWSRTLREMAAPPDQP